MNKTISLVAITLVAVVMGMSVLAPAMATPSGGDGEKHNPKVIICHFDFNEMQWEADKRVNAHSLVAHLAHGDALIDDHTGDHEEGNHITEFDCTDQDDPPPKDTPPG